MAAQASYRWGDKVSQNVDVLQRHFDVQHHIQANGGGGMLGAIDSAQQALSKTSQSQMNHFQKKSNSLHVTPSG